MPSPLKIDAHQHFWQIARGDYSWMSEEVAPIRKDILPRDLAPLLKQHHVAGTVVVQAAPTVAETEFLLSLSTDNAFIKGIVGWVDLTSSDVADILERLRTNPKFKGIRPMLQDIAQTDWIAQPQVMTALQDVARMGLRFDALITPRHLGVIYDLAKNLPDLQIVIDHCAKPAIAHSPDPGADWREGISRFAACPNVMCKLSGLANEAGPNWDAQRLRPVVDHVLDSFGTGRILWGSDWPVLTLAGDYAGWLNTTDDLLSALSEDEKEQVYHRNALQFYGLEI